MVEKVEVPERLGNLMRMPYGTPIYVEYSDPYDYEIEPKSGRKRPLKHTYVPRFNNRNYPPGTLVEIPLGGGNYYEVTFAKKGQEKPNSLYTTPITEARFNELKSNGAKVVRPDNLP